MSTFQDYGKTPRWNREVVITEKIDGTNSAVIIEEEVGQEWSDALLTTIALSSGGVYRVYAQSRSRLITPGKTTDNYGFAGWVKGNAGQLVDLLGPGRHFGEWYGQGIQRNYGLDHKRFALFNTGRWTLEDTRGSGLPVDVVPVLATVPIPSHDVIRGQLDVLREHGSLAVPGFMRPEGVVLFHTASRQSYKILLENDELPKSAVA